MLSLDLLRSLNGPATIAVTGALFFSAFLLYQWLIPKPIPGVPYNDEARKTIFGDIPSLVKHTKTSKVIIDWMNSHTERHNSPIVQVWIQLFGRPTVIVNDFREAQDILLRRTKEFDKPDMLSDLMWGANPEHHTVQASNDRFRSQRKLMQDLMTPTFLHGVAAPQLHNNFMDMITLWQEKLRLGQGHVFSVRKDIYETALEAIWATIFGIDATETITRNQVQLLSPLKDIPLPADEDEAVDFPQAAAPADMHAVLKITDSFEEVLKSPFPIVQGFIQRYYPSQRRAQKIKNQAIHAQISQAEERMNSSIEGTDKITNAVDHMLRREKAAAARQNRAPQYHSEVVVAELFGLLVAGHDTTSTTLLWSAKYLAAHQTIQSRLRATLQSSFKDAYAEHRAPTASEIASTTNHYLDACIEEIVRYAGTASLPSRTATQDAVVLGHVIPKGTTILFSTNYAGTRTPSFTVPPALRSPSYHAAGGGKTGEWAPETIHLFDPERWLVPGHDGEKVFDASAGPVLQFGAGPRGCFGRRLAYLELRLALVLILWHYELGELPQRYAGWEATDGLTHAPQECVVNLKEVEW